jgi:hypothetical protein
VVGFASVRLFKMAHYSLLVPKAACPFTSFVDQPPAVRISTAGCVTI